MLTVKFIAVGSTNPVKVAAVRAIAHDLWPDAGLETFRVAIAYALAPFLQPLWYSQNSWEELCESID